MNLPSYKTLNVRSDEHIVRVHLNRPDVRNAFNQEMISDLTDVFVRLGKNESVRAIVLGGEGKVFCAGADIRWMSASIDCTEDENVADAKTMAHMYQTVDTCPVPVVGRVQRAAFGGAIGLISACDIVVAEVGTKLCFSEVRLGILPAVISSFSMTKIGVSQARRYFITAEVFLAEDAPVGLIHEVVPPDALDATVDSILDHIQANGPRAVRETKKLIPQVAESTRAEAIELCSKTIARVRVGKEGQAGLRAFLDKTDPPWRKES